MRILIYTALIQNSNERAIDAEALRPARGLCKFGKHQIEWALYIHHTSQIKTGTLMKGWTVHKTTVSFAKSRLYSRYIKVNIHRIHGSPFDVGIWLDAAYSADPSFIGWVIGLLEAYGGETIFATTHPKRNCSYAEMKYCKLHGMYSHKEFENQSNAYKTLGFPRMFGLLESGFVMRRNLSILDGFFDLWWKLIKKYSERDQTSLMVALWATQTPYFELSKVDLLQHVRKVKTINPSRQGHRKKRIMNLF